MIKVKTIISAVEDAAINQFIENKNVKEIIPFVKMGHSAFLIVYEEGKKTRKKLVESVEESSEDED